MAAVRCSGSECGDDQSDSEWIAAFGPAETYDEPSAVAAARAICEHGINNWESDKCDQGGNIIWYPPDSDYSEVRFAYFPEYQDQVEQQLVDGAGPSWRLDPIGTVETYWIEEHTLCVEDNSAGMYPRCRVGFGTPTVDGSTAAVTVTMQWAFPAGEPEVLYYETYVRHLTLASTGLAWWVTSFREDPPMVHGDSNEGRAASDELWAQCCRTVLVDVEEGIKPEQ
jgi:hypothetical protein